MYNIIPIDQLWPIVVKWYIYIYNIITDQVPDKMEPKSNEEINESNL